MNTSNAGPGALAVTIDGPSKVKMDCVECPEGYRVTYTPMAPGNYLISIKYGGPYHIVGSPFKAKITGEEDLCFSGRRNVNANTSEINALFPVSQVPSSCPAIVCTKPRLSWSTP